MALKDWKSYLDDYHKKAYKSKTGKIVSIGKLPKDSPFDWVVYTPRTARKFKTLGSARKHQRNYMMRNR